MKHAAGTTEVVSSVANALHEPYKELKHVIHRASAGRILSRALHEPYKELKHNAKNRTQETQKSCHKGLHEPYKELGLLQNPND